MHKKSKLYVIYYHCKVEIIQNKYGIHLPFRLHFDGEIPHKREVKYLVWQINLKFLLIIELFFNVFYMFGIMSRAKAFLLLSLAVANANLCLRWKRQMYTVYNFLMGSTQRVNESRLEKVTVTSSVLQKIFIAPMPYLL